MALSRGFVRAPPARGVVRPASTRPRLRHRRAFPPAPSAAAPSSSSDSSSSTSTIAQLAPSGAVFLREPPPSSKGVDDDEPSDVSSSFSSGRGCAADSALPAVDVVVFGVDHGDPDPSLGSFVLSCTPCSVVVETAMCERHGAATGNAVSLSEGGHVAWETETENEPDSEEPHVAQCLSLAERLSCLPDGSPEKTSFWAAMSSHFAGEQLCYIAALSTGARLVFGDKPKRETVLGLIGGGGRRTLSAADLDAAVAAQASSNTLETLTRAPAPPPPTDGGRFGRAYDVLVRERDATICFAVAREVDRELSRRRAETERDDEGDDGASSSASASTSFSPSPGPLGAPRPVVVVVGKWHVEGVRSLWESGEWRDVLEANEGDDGTTSPSRHPRLSAAEDAGLRRALADELLRSTSTADSAEEIDPEFFGGSLLKFSSADVDVDGPERSKAEREARRAYDLTYELYGTARMQLALLDDRREFESVVSGWRCDFWEVLEPLRSLRASKGGAGFDEGAVASLRALNFVLG